ncbi:putative Casein kinase I [Blattamonas nauphoetae]|uniref:Casein kinase I n=1 Tax=Blattamonas nauphoetae TaxID=2049346 RepID=A0ABQ9Y9K6_9EUKA|nr:putative Casein kinase I [Blattamonas nauphoetae]
MFPLLSILILPFCESYVIPVVEGVPFCFSDDYAPDIAVRINYTYTFLSNETRQGEISPKVTIRDPESRPILHAESRGNGHVLLTVGMPGEHSVCFSFGSRNTLRPRNAMLAFTVETGIGTKIEVPMKDETPEQYLQRLSQKLEMIQLDQLHSVQRASLSMRNDFRDDFERQIASQGSWVIADVYKVSTQKQIGAGSFGHVFKARVLTTDEDVAIKIEESNVKTPTLYYETRLYKLLQGGVGIPNIRWYGADSGYNVMVMDLLGHSLDDLFVKCGRKFSLKTVLMIAEQTITRVEYIHSKNFVHRDLKPGNLAIGRGSKENIIYLIDLGLAKRFKDSKTHQHIPYKESKGITGTVRYTSINSHIGIEPSRRDDLETLAYIFIEFLTGTLPWSRIRDSSKRKKFLKIGDLKMGMSVDELCKGVPKEFADYLRYCRNLRFDEKPDYAYLRKLFRELMKSSGYTNDQQFDWIKLSEAKRKEEEENEMLKAEEENSDDIIKNGRKPKKDEDPKEEHPVILVNDEDEVRPVPKARYLGLPESGSGSPIVPGGFLNSVDLEFREKKLNNDRIVAERPIEVVIDHNQPERKDVSLRVHAFRLRGGSEEDGQYEDEQFEEEVYRREEEARREEERKREEEERKEAEELRRQRKRSPSRRRKDDERRRERGERKDGDRSQIKNGTKPAPRPILQTDQMREREREKEREKEKERERVRKEEREGEKERYRELQRIKDRMREQERLLRKQQKDKDDKDKKDKADIHKHQVNQPHVSSTTHQNSRLPVHRSPPAHIQTSPSPTPSPALSPSAHSPLPSISPAHSPPHPTIQHLNQAVHFTHHDKTRNHQLAGKEKAGPAQEGIIQVPTSTTLQNDQLTDQRLAVPLGMVLSRRPIRTENKPTNENENRKDDDFLGEWGALGGGTRRTGRVLSFSRSGSGNSSPQQSQWGSPGVSPALGPSHNPIKTQHHGLPEMHIGSSGFDGAKLIEEVSQEEKRRTLNKLAKTSPGHQIHMKSSRLAISSLPQPQLSAFVTSTLGMVPFEAHEDKTSTVKDEAKTDTQHTQPSNRSQNEQLTPAAQLQLSLSLAKDATQEVQEKPIRQALYVPLPPSRFARQEGFGARGLILKNSSLAGLRERGRRETVSGINPLITHTPFRRESFSRRRDDEKENKGEQKEDNPLNDTPPDKLPPPINPLNPQPDSKQNKLGVQPDEACADLSTPTKPSSRLSIAVTSVNDQETLSRKGVMDDSGKSVVDGMNEILNEFRQAHVTPGLGPSSAPFSPASNPDTPTTSRLNNTPLLRNLSGSHLVNDNSSFPSTPLITDQSNSQRPRSLLASAFPAPNSLDPPAAHVDIGSRKTSSKRSLERSSHQDSDDDTSDSSDSLISFIRNNAHKYTSEYSQSGTIRRGSHLVTKPVWISPVATSMHTVECRGAVQSRK